MNNWIEVRVRYQKTGDNGKSKKVTEQYLVDALSVSEAEIKITREMEKIISNDFSVSAVKKCKYSDVLFGNGDRWYRINFEYLTIDERTGLENKTPCYILIQACDIYEALDSFTNYMKNSLADYAIAGVNLTKVINVFQD